MSLRSTGRNAEARDDLIENQQAIVPGCEVAQSLEEWPADRHLAPMAAGRFQDDAADLRIVAQCLLDGIKIIGGNDDGELRKFGGNTRHRFLMGIIRAGKKEIVPAVEMTREFQNARPAGENACQAQGHHGGLGARAGEAHALGRRYQSLDPLPPFDLAFVTSARMRGFLHLPLHRLDNGGMAMPQQDGSVAGPVIDQLPALHGPLVSAGSAIDIDAERLQVARVVRDPVGKHAASLFVQFPRARKGSRIAFNKRRTGQRCLGHQRFSFILSARSASKNIPCWRCGLTNHFQLSTSSYVPPPAFLSFPCLTNSSQTAGENWFGGMMATMRARPWLNGPPPSFDSSSSCVSFKRFLNALSACFNSCGVGPPPAEGFSVEDIASSILLARSSYSFSRSRGWTAYHPFINVCCNRCRACRSACHAASA